MRLNDVFTVRKTPWLRLPFWVRMAIGGTALLLPLAGGAAAVTAIVTRPPAAPARLGQPLPAGAPDLPSPHADSGLGPRPEVPAPAAGPADTPPTASATRTPADRAASPATPPSPAPAVPGTLARPAVTTTTMTVTEVIPYRTQRVRDPAMPQRAQRVVTPGANGSREITYQVTTSEGRAPRRKVVSTRVVRKPVTEVVAVGTAREDSPCDHHDDDDCGPRS